MLAEYDEAIVVVSPQDATVDTSSLRSSSTSTFNPSSVLNRVKTNSYVDYDGEISSDVDPMIADFFASSSSSSVPQSNQLEREPESEYDAYMKQEFNYNQQQNQLRNHPAIVAILNNGDGNGNGNANKSRGAAVSRPIPSLSSSLSSSSSSSSSSSLPASAPGLASDLSHDVAQIRALSSATRAPSILSDPIKSSLPLHDLFPSISNLNPSSLRELHEVGRGNFGIVYYGEYNNKPVVIKKLKTVTAVEDDGEVGGKQNRKQKTAQEKMKERLKDELTNCLHEASMLQLAGSHPNRISLIGLCIYDSCVALVTSPYCSLGTIESFILSSSSTASNFIIPSSIPRCFKKANHSISIEEIELFELMADIARGVEHLHEINITHNDLATRNYIIARTDETDEEEEARIKGRRKGNRLHARLCDFGLARLIQPKLPPSSSASPSPIMNTAPPAKFNPRWAPPEVFVPPHTFSPSSDSWSFGISLWECLAQSLPYPHLAREQIAPRIVHKNETPTCKTEWGDEINQIMMECWTKNVNERIKMKQVRGRMEEMVERMKETKREQEDEMQDGENEFSEFERLKAQLQRPLPFDPVTAQFNKSNSTSLAAGSEMSNTFMKPVSRAISNTEESRTSSSSSSSADVSSGERSIAVDFDRSHNEPNQVFRSFQSASFSSSFQSSSPSTSKLSTTNSIAGILGPSRPSLPSTKATALSLFAQYGDDYEFTQSEIEDYEEVADEKMSDDPTVMKALQQRTVSAPVPSSSAFSSSSTPFSAALSKSTSSSSSSTSLSSARGASATASASLPVQKSSSGSGSPSSRFTPSSIINNSQVTNLSAPGFSFGSPTRKVLRSTSSITAASAPKPAAALSKAPAPTSSVSSSASSSSYDSPLSLNPFASARENLRSTAQRAPAGGVTGSASPRSFSRPGLLPSPLSSTTRPSFLSSSSSSSAAARPSFVQSQATSFTSSHHSLSLHSSVNQPSSDLSRAEEEDVAERSGRVAKGDGRSGRGGARGGGGGGRDLRGGGTERGGGRGSERERRAVVKARSLITEKVGQTQKASKLSRKTSSQSTAMDEEATLDENQKKSKDRDFAADKQTNAMNKISQPKRDEAPSSSSSSSSSFSPSSSSVPHSENVSAPTKSIPRSDHSLIQVDSSKGSGIFSRFTNMFKSRSRPTDPELELSKETQQMENIEPDADGSHLNEANIMVGKSYTESVKRKKKAKDETPKKKEEEGDQEEVEEGAEVGGEEDDEDEEDEWVGSTPGDDNATRATRRGVVRRALIAPSGDESYDEDEEHLSAGKVSKRSSDAKFETDEDNDMDLQNVLMQSYQNSVEQQQQQQQQHQEHIQTALPSAPAAPVLRVPVAAPLAAPIFAPPPPPSSSAASPPVVASSAFPESTTEIEPDVVEKTNVFTDGPSIARFFRPKALAPSVSISSPFDTSSSGPFLLLSRSQISSLIPLSTTPQLFSVTLPQSIIALVAPYTNLSSSSPSSSMLSSSSSSSTIARFIGSVTNSPSSSSESSESIQSSSHEPISVGTDSTDPLHLLRQRFDLLTRDQTEKGNLLVPVAGVASNREQEWIGKDRPLLLFDEQRVKYTAEMALKTIVLNENRSSLSTGIQRQFFVASPPASREVFVPMMQSRADPPPPQLPPSRSSSLSISSLLLQLARALSTLHSTQSLYHGGVHLDQVYVDEDQVTTRLMIVPKLVEKLATTTTVTAAAAAAAAAVNLSGNLSSSSSSASSSFPEFKTSESSPDYGDESSLSSHSRYLSPEQLLDRTTGQSSDIWQFGIIIWQLLTMQQQYEQQMVAKQGGQGGEEVSITVPEPYERELKEVYNNNIDNLFVAITSGAANLTVPDEVQDTFVGTKLRKLMQLCLSVETDVRPSAEDLLKQLQEIKAKE